MDKPTLTKTPSKNNLERKAICFSLAANESLVLSCLQEFLCCEPWLPSTLTVSTAFLREKHLFTRSSVSSSFLLRLHLQQLTANMILSVFLVLTYTCTKSFNSICWLNLIAIWHVRKKRLLLGLKASVNTRTDFFIWIKE